MTAFVLFLMFATGQPLMMGYEQQGDCESIRTKAMRDDQVQWVSACTPVVAYKKDDQKT